MAVEYFDAMTQLYLAHFTQRPGSDTKPGLRSGGYEAGASSWRYERSGIAGMWQFHGYTLQFSVDSGDSISIDAKQRVVYSLEKSYRNGDKWRAVCAEPSPDAIAAISAGTGVGVEKLQLALAASLSVSEGAASIGLRTQTIQLLRDAMYRLCEGYASNALDEIGFARLQRRYQNVMLGLLAIEQLTGAVTPKQAVLGGSADSAAAVSRRLAEIAEALDEARSKKRDAEEKLAASQAAEKKAEEEHKAAKAAYDVIVKDEPNGAAAESAQKHKKEVLDPAQAKLDDATKLVAVRKRDDEDQQANVLAYEEAARSLARVSARAASSGSLDGGSTISTINAQTATAVSDAVQGIVLGIVKHDYGREGCLDFFLSRSPRALEVDEGLSQAALQFCKEVIDADAQVEKERLEKASKGVVGDATKKLFDESAKNIRRQQPQK